MSQLSDELIHIITDKKTHFPLMEIKGFGSVTLWPITKIQFEMFMSETNKFGDFWYDEILDHNPRISFKNFNEGNYEQLFITGLLPEEAMSFSQWFDTGFRIPTGEEWREIFKLLNAQLNFNKPSDLSNPANKIWDKFSQFSETPIKFSLMQEGVFDWVQDGGEYGAYGKPRLSKYPHTCNPLRDAPLKKFRIDVRSKYQGFRLIRR